jgi:hypothetical protein
MGVGESILEGAYFVDIGLQVVEDGFFPFHILIVLYLQLIVIHTKYF